MKTNNETGRMFCIIIGVYLVGKELINMMLGFLNGGGPDFIGLLRAVALTVLLISGLKTGNYLVAVVLTAMMLNHLGDNLANLGSNLIYLIEGIIDVICAVIVCITPSIREHCTNSSSDIFGGDGY